MRLVGTTRKLDQAISLNPDMRGSTLFVAWNMSTSDEARPGIFRFSRDLRDAFRAPGDHAVLVKVSIG